MFGDRVVDWLVSNPEKSPITFSVFFLENSNKFRNFGSNEIIESFFKFLDLTDPTNSHTFVPRRVAKKVPVCHFVKVELLLGTTTTTTF